jgi:hypothetical protein
MTKKDWGYFHALIIHGLENCRIMPPKKAGIADPNHHHL